MGWWNVGGGATGLGGGIGAGPGAAGPDGGTNGFGATSSAREERPVSQASVAENANAGAAMAGSDQASPGRRHDTSINSISAAPAQ